MWTWAWCIYGISRIFREDLILALLAANASAFLFQTTFLHLGGYSATNTITYALFLKHVVRNVRDRNVRDEMTRNFHESVDFNIHCC